MKILFIFIFLCTQLIQSQQFLKGADLSFANELQNVDECDITFKKNATDTATTDVYDIFKQHGCNVVRARLWYGESNPISGNYSTIEDVKNTFIKAKSNSPWVKTLLTIHYSDEWADPGEQKTPLAWNSITNAAISTQLTNSITNYTENVIDQIGKGRIDYIAIGNETNGGFICPTADDNCQGIDEVTRYNRMKQLIQTGINAARNKGFAKHTVMVHVAGPGNAWWWLNKMGVGKPGGLNNFGLVGLSYYPALPENLREGHNMSTSEVGRIIKNIIGKYRVRPMIVETSHPYTNNYTRYNPNDESDTDKQNRINYTTSYESFDNLTPTPEKQRIFMERLTDSVYSAGGLGVISWEPAWVSPVKGKEKCVNDKDFGYGSDQEHHTFFSMDNNHSVIADGGITFMNRKKNYNVLGFREVVFILNIPSVPAGQIPHLAVDFDSSNLIDFGDWYNERVQMIWDNTRNAWTATVLLRKDRTYKYRYQSGYDPIYAEQLSGSNCSNGQAIREVTAWSGGGKQLVTNWYGTCFTAQSWTSLKANIASLDKINLDISEDVKLAPNPASESVTIQSNSNKVIKNITINDMIGRQHATYSPNSTYFNIDISSLQKGVYVVIIDTQLEKITKKLIVR